MPGCSHVAAALTLRSKPERACMRPAGSCTCRCNNSRSSQNCCCRHRRHKASSGVATIHSRSHSLSGRSHSWRCCRTHRFRSGRKRYRDRQRSLDDRLPRRKDEEGQRPGDQEVRWDERDQRARRRRKDEEGQRRPQDPEDRPDQGDQQDRRRACRPGGGPPTGPGGGPPGGGPGNGWASATSGAITAAPSTALADRINKVFCNFMVGLLRDAPSFPIRGWRILRGRPCGPRGGSREATRYSCFGCRPGEVA